MKKQVEPIPALLRGGSQNLERNLTSVAAASIYGGLAIGASPTIPQQTIPETAVNSQDATSTTVAISTTNWSTSLQTLLDQPPATFPRQLLLGGLVFCLAFVAWATFGQIDEVGHSRGRLAPKGEVYKIHPIEAGKVVSIRVKEGQSVKAGEALVELDREIATADIERLQQTLVADQIQLDQMQSLIHRTLLEAQTRGEIAQADTLIQQGAIAQAKAKNQAALAVIAQNQESTATKQQLLTQLQADVDASQARLERLKPLLEKGAIAKELVFQGEQTLRDHQRNMTQSQGELQQALTEANRLQAELQQSLAATDQLQIGLTQKQTEVRRTQIEAQQKAQQLEVEKTQLKAKIAENQNLLSTAKAKLKQRFLYAPVSGIVSSLNILNIGEVVQPGQTLAEIAPENTPLVLSASLPNQEAGLVKVGMPVQVKLDAFPYQNYGIFTGKVLSISPDTKPDQQLGPVYRVQVSLDRSSVTANHQTIPLKAGGTATAEIILRRRRIADILLDPIRQLQKGGINL